MAYGVDDGVIIGLSFLKMQRMLGVLEWEVLWVERCTAQRGVRSESMLRAYCKGR